MIEVCLVLLILMKIISICLQLSIFREMQNIEYGYISTNNANIAEISNSIYKLINKNDRIISFLRSINNKLKNGTEKSKKCDKGQ